MGDEEWDDWDDVSTEMYSEAKLLDPVDKVSDLPTEGIAEGALCFVEENGGVYKFRKGRWVERAVKQ